MPATKLKQLSGGVVAYVVGSVPRSDWPAIVPPDTTIVPMATSSARLAIIALVRRIARRIVCLIFTFTPPCWFWHGWWAVLVIYSYYTEAGYGSQQVGLMWLQAHDRAAYETEYGNRPLTDDCIQYSGCEPGAAGR